MVQCPSCARSQEPRLVCADCGTPLAAPLDYFAAFGLPRKLQVDTSELERRYYEFGRRIHPDRFAASSAKLRDASLRATSLLTRAYRVLRDPVDRGLYWLELNGRKLADNNKQVPPALAALVFEVQEQLTELRQAQTAPAETEHNLRDRMIDKRGELQLAIDDSHKELELIFERFDCGDSGTRENLFVDLKSILSKIAYLKTLIRDVDRELDALKAA
jgi:molecular chaperone HscB